MSDFDNPYAAPQSDMLPPAPLSAAPHVESAGLWRDGKLTVVRIAQLGHGANESESDDVNVTNFRSTTPVTSIPRCRAARNLKSRTTCFCQREGPPNKSSCPSRGLTKTSRVSTRRHPANAARSEVIRFSSKGRYQ